MKSNIIAYNAVEDKTERQVHFYLKTHKAPHRYLCYRDIPGFIRQFVKGKKALDYGSGTGFSTSFLHELGFDVIGVDISSNMLKQAQTIFPTLKFFKAKDLMPGLKCDLVFSSFVLLELSSKKKIEQYLKRCSHFLKKDAIFIAITSSDDLYSPFRKWFSFNTNFKENYNLKSGKLVKILLKNPNIEFNDYFWKTKDYLGCFKKAGLEILKIHHPVGYSQEPYLWQDEMFSSPFAIFIARKS